MQFSVIAAALLWFSVTSFALWWVSSRYADVQLSIARNHSNPLRTMLALLAWLVFSALLVTPLLVYIFAARRALSPRLADDFDLSAIIMYGISLIPALVRFNRRRTELRRAGYRI